MTSDSGAEIKNLIYSTNCTIDPQGKVPKATSLRQLPPKDHLGLPHWLSGKESACNAGDPGDRVFDPWVGKIPWRRKWQPTPVFLPGKSHGQRTLAGYRPWGREESDMT